MLAYAPNRTRQGPLRVVRPPHHGHIVLLRPKKCTRSRSRPASDEQHRVYAAVILRMVGHLRVLAPDDLAAGCDEAEVRAVDLDDGAFGDHTE